MIEPRKFRIKETGTNCKNMPSGTIVYDFLGCDYGLASDDSRMLGAKYVSVTLDPAGGHPSFTVLESSLEIVPHIYPGMHGDEG